MSLHLTGKDSVLSAIGGVTKTAANAVIAAPKDIGDLISEGVGQATGNLPAAQNASSAISSNDSNLSGESLPQNLGGLSEDIGVTPAAREIAAIPPGIVMAGTNAVDSTPQDASQFAADEPGALGDIARFASDNGKTNISSPRVLAGNTLGTAVNVLTLGKGKAVEGLVEKAVGDKLGDSAASKVVARLAGTGTVTGGYGAGQGASQAVESAQTPSEAATDVLKPAAENAALGGVIGVGSTIPALVKETPVLDEVEGINNTPVTAPEPPPEPTESVPNEPTSSTTPPVAPGASEEDLSDLHAAGLSSTTLPPLPTEAEPEFEEPSPLEMQQATDNLNADIAASDIDWTKVQGANQELAQKAKEVAQGLREQDVEHRKVNGPSDLYKRIRASGGISSSDYEDIPTHLKNSRGASMDKVAQDLGYKSDDELHAAIEREKSVRDTSQTPLKSAAHYQDLAKQYIAEHPDQFDNVARRAQAETHFKEFESADKTSGYNKAKWQIPKGAPARKFVQALWDKTHSPEYQARNDVGAQLGDVRSTLKGVKTLRDRSQKEFNALTQKGSQADEPTIRAKTAELRSQNTRYRVLKGIEQQQALNYRTLAEKLDEKYPDINLSAKRGVRLTSGGGSEFETAKPTGAPVKVRSAAGSKEEESLTDQILDGADPHELVAKTRQGKAYLEEEVRKADGLPHGFTPTKEPIGAKEPDGIEAPPMDLSGLSDYDQEDQPPMRTSPLERRNIESDKVIIEGIKRGDSDAAIIKGYMDATGSDVATAKKAYGLLEDDPNVDKAGAVENNPYHGKVANYDIDSAPKRGLGKVLLRSKTTARALINKALLRSVGYGDHLAYKHLDASDLWNKLSPEDQALADKLRNHSIEEVTKEAKDPTDFKAYATRAKDIEDYIHEVRSVADPFDITPYRQNYGASFHLADEEGEPVSLDQKEGQGHAFQGARHYSTYQDVEQATGLKRASQDFHEDLTKDVVAAQHHTAVNSLYYGLKQAFGDDAVSLGKRTTTATTPLKEFDGIYATKDIADRINSRAQYEYNPSDRATSLLKGYDKLNSSMKNIKLSVGGFHNINIMLNQAALNPMGVGAATRALIDPEAFRAQMNTWDADGTMEKALHSGLTLGGGGEFGASGSLINRAPIIKTFHDALFNRQIPFSKMQVFERYTRGLELNNAADYDKMRGVARGINNTFGGINRLVDGLSPGALKNIGRAVLAADYNEGQIRTLLSALDPRKFTTTEGRMARQVVAARAAILAVPGTLQAIHDKTIGNNPKEITKFIGQQFVNPTVTTGWKTQGGIPKKVSLIAGIVNKTDRAVAPALDKNNPNKFSGIDSELSGNLSPAGSLGEEEKTNKDYYGNPVRTGSLAQDAGAILSASAPIPASPGARALEGTRFGKNAVTKDLAGGESAISPGEAAVDISGAGRVAADPNAPEMRILNSRQMLSQGLKSSQDKAALQDIHPNWDGALTKAEENAIYSNKYYENNKWSALNENGPGSQVYSVLEKQNKVAMASGEPGDPLLALSKNDYQIVTEYEKLKHEDEGTDANNTAAVMYAQNSKMIDTYESANTAYENKMNALYNVTSGTKGSNEPVEAVGGAPQYSETPQQTALANQYYAMTDSTQRANFLTNNPQLSTLFEAQFQAENAIRAQQGEPLLKDYPQASAELNSWMNTYIAASKTQRTSLREGNTTLYNQMSDYLAQVDAYELSKTAGQAQFQGQNLSQDNLKDIYDLGQYDIAPPAGASDLYDLNPQEAYTDSSGSGGSGGSSRAENLINELISEDHARDIKESVKYATKTAKVRIRKSNRYYPKKVKIGKAKAAPVRIKAKSVPTT